MKKSTSSYRKNYTAAEKEEYYQKKTEELNNMMEQINTGVQEVMQTEKYKAFLRFSSAFTNYSFNNTMLISLQKPDASYVAGYTTWSKLNRQVKKGSKGISIFAPIQVKTNQVLEYDKEITDNDGKPLFNEDGTAMTETVEKPIKRLAFKAQSVFDITQTDGEPIPSLVTELQGENIEEKDVILRSVEKCTNAPISFADITTGSKGFYTISTHTITIKTGMSDLQTIKTALHEGAHALLHSNDETSALSIRATTNEREMQAESVAFMAASKLGLDTSEYSFPYIATWSDGKPIEHMKKHMEQIHAAASKLIDTITEELVQFRKQELEQELSYPVELKFETYDDNDTLISETSFSVHNTYLKETYDISDTSLATISEAFENSDDIRQVYEEALLSDKILSENTQLFSEGYGELIKSVQKNLETTLEYVENAEKNTLYPDEHDISTILKNVGYSSSIARLLEVAQEKSKTILEVANVPEELAEIYHGLTAIKPNTFETFASGEPIEFPGYVKSELISGITACKSVLNSETFKNYICNSNESTYISSNISPEDIKKYNLPMVTVEFSEHSYFENDRTYTFAEANRIFDSLDHDVNLTKKQFSEISGGEAYFPYYKTSFIINYTDNNGEQGEYRGRYDIGDGDGSLLRHIADTAKSSIQLFTEQVECEKRKPHPDEDSIKEYTEIIEDCKKKIYIFVPYLETALQLEDAISVRDSAAINRDKMLEKMYAELEDVTMIEQENKELVLSSDWKMFKAGTPQSEIFEFFDKNYSKGIGLLDEQLQFIEPSIEPEPVKVPEKLEKDQIQKVVSLKELAARAKARSNATISNSTNFPKKII